MNCMTCKFAHKEYHDTGTKSLQTLECRRNPPQLVEADKWSSGHERSFKDGKEVKSWFPEIPFELDFAGGMKTDYFCGEYIE